MTSFQPVTISTSEELISGFVASNLRELFKRFIFFFFFETLAAVARKRDILEHLYRPG